MMARLAYLLIGWLAVGAVVYSTWRVPRLPSVLDIVGLLPEWTVAAGAGMWCVVTLALVSVGLASRRTPAMSGLVIGGMAAAIILVVFPLYLLSQSKGWRRDLGLAIGFVWTACVLADKIAFLIRARAERRQRQ